MTEPSAAQPRRRWRWLDALMGVAVLGSIALTFLPTFQAPESRPLPIVVLCAWALVSVLVSSDRHLRAGGWVARTLVIMFAVQVALALVHYGLYWPEVWRDYQAGLTRFDACLYHDYALQLAAQGLRGSGPWEGINYSGIVYYYGMLYFFFGANPAVAVVANSLASMLTALFLYKFLMAFSSVRVAAGAALTFAMLPESILWSSLPMKECLVTLVFMYGLYSGMRLVRHPLWYRWIIPLLSFFCLIQLRMVLAIVFVISFLVLVALRFSRRPLMMVCIVVIALGGMVALAGVSRAPIAEYGSPFSLRFYQSQVRIFNERSEDENAVNVGTSLGVRTSGALTEGKLYWIPVRFVMYYLNPPPWVRGYGTWDPFRMSSALVVWLLMPAMFYGLYILGGQRSRGYPLLIPFMVGSVLISSATPFLDDRLRMMMMPLFLGVAFWGLSYLRRWWQLYMVLPFVATFGAVLYYLFKAGWLG